MGDLPLGTARSHPNLNAGLGGSHASLQHAGLQQQQQQGLGISAMNRCRLPMGPVFLLFCVKFQPSAWLSPADSMLRKPGKQLSASRRRLACHPTPYSSIIGGSNRTNPEHLLKPTGRPLRRTSAACTAASRRSARAWACRTSRAATAAWRPHTSAAAAAAAAATAASRTWRHWTLAGVPLRRRRPVCLASGSTSWAACSRRRSSSSAPRARRGRHRRLARTWRSRVGKVRFFHVRLCAMFSSCRILA